MTKRPTREAHAADAAWARLIAEADSPPPRTQSLAEHLQDEKRHKPKIDRRSLKKTGRTEQFNVRLTVATKQEIQALAEEHDCLIGEVIEQAVAALREKIGRSS